MRDPLVGQFFSAPLSKTLHDYPEWRGRIIDRVPRADGDYVVELVDGTRLVVPYHEIREWALFASEIAREAVGGCREPEAVITEGRLKRDGFCGRPVTHLIDLPGLGWFVRCSRCAAFYSGTQRELVTADFEPPPPPLDIATARLEIVNELSSDLRDLTQAKGAGE